MFCIFLCPVCIVVTLISFLLILLSVVSAGCAFSPVLFTYCTLSVSCAFVLFSSKLFVFCSQHYVPYWPFWDFWVCVQCLFVFVFPESLANTPDRNRASHIFQEANICQSQHMFSSISRAAICHVIIQSNLILYLFSTHPFLCASYHLGFCWGEYWKWNTEAAVCWAFAHHHQWDKSYLPVLHAMRSDTWLHYFKS